MTTWLVDEYIIKDNKDEFVNSFKELETKYILISIESDYTYPDMSIPDKVILYGSIRFVKNYYGKFSPGAYGFSDKTDCSYYYSYIPKHMLLNGECIFLTFDQIKNSKNMIKNIFGNNIFLKSNSGFKKMTGNDFDIDNFEYYMELIENTQSISPNTLMLVSKKRNIDREFRFVICNRTIIGATEYSWDKDCTNIIPNSCYNLINKFLKLNFDIDDIYTVDVCLSDEVPYILELNSFSCAGLYKSNVKNIIKHINQYVENTL